MSLGEQFLMFQDQEEQATCGKMYNIGMADVGNGCPEKVMRQ
jgi:hypothetical protein